MDKKTKEKYLKLIAGKKWEKTEIQGFLKKLNGMRFSKNETVKDSIQELWSDFEYEFHHGKEWKISAAQSQYGIEYLNTRYFKKNGDPRASCPFNTWEQAIIKNFKRFTFSGIYIERNAYGTEWFHPIYKVYDTAGNAFEYTPIHWGMPILYRNGQPEVMGIEKKSEGNLAYVSNSAPEKKTFERPAFKLILGGRL